MKRRKKEEKSFTLTESLTLITGPSFIHSESVNAVTVLFSVSLALQSSSRVHGLQRHGQVGSPGLCLEIIRVPLCHPQVQGSLEKLSNAPHNFYGQRRKKNGGEAEREKSEVVGWG